MGEREAKMMAMQEISAGRRRLKTPIHEYGLIFFFLSFLSSCDTNIISISWACLQERLVLGVCSKGEEIDCG